MYNHFSYIIYTIFFVFTSLVSFAQQAKKSNDTQNFFHEVESLKLSQQKNLKSLDSVLIIWHKQKSNPSLSSHQKFYLAKEIAHSYFSLDLYIEASEFYKKSANLLKETKAIDSDEQVKFYDEISHFYYSVSNNKGFRYYLLKVIGIQEENPRKFLKELTEAYDKLINNYLEYGDINNAKLYRSKLESLAVINELAPGNLHHKLWLTSLLYDLKITVAEKKIAASESIYNELKQYFFNLKSKRDYLVYYAEATNFYTEAIFKTGRNKEALDILDESIMLHKEMGNDLSLLNTYSYYSYLVRELKDYNTAHLTIDKAISLLTPNNFLDLSGLFTSKGIIYFNEKKFEKAVECFDKAHLLIKNIDNSNFHLLSYNIEISKKYFEIYKETGNEKLLQQSFNSYKYSVKQFLDFYENGFLNQLLAEFKNNITEGLLNIGMESKSNVSEIVEMIENIQSRFLWKNYLLNSRFDNAELVNELSQIKTLQLKLASISVLSADKNQTRLSKTQIKNQIELLEKKLIEKYPYYHNIFSPTFVLADFLAKMNTEILHFYVVNNSIFGVHLKSKNDIAIKKIGNTDEIKKKVAMLNEKLQEKTSLEYESKYLYKKFLKPFNLASPQITIVSNSFISKFPFEFLIDDKGDYVVEKYSINYAISLSLYEIQNKHKNRNNFRLAVFQPRYNNKTMPTLPFAEKEATYLQQKFESVLFSGKEASKKNFISNASNFSIYHLPMHAIIDDNEEDISRLLLDDEDFYFSDFYAQRFPLDLVVLSACETGVGKIVEGEGIMSLSRAFTHSGVASTVYSLWEIPDKQTFEIMQLFYDNLSKGFSKSEALQKAKIEYIKSCKAEKLRHPFYWSGFVLNGNPEALIEKKNDRAPYFLAIFIIPFGWLLFLKLRK